MSRKPWRPLAISRLKSGQGWPNSFPVVALYWRRYGARTLLAVWALGCLGLGANLLAFHLVALPSPDPTDHRLVGALRTLPKAAGRWQLVHFLYTDCPCASQVADHLLARPSPMNTTEHVVLVGQAPQLIERLRKLHFTVEVVDEVELEQRFGVTSVPLLVIADPSGELRYSGGYSTRKQGPVQEDLSILARLQGGAPVSPLPIFGCAVSRELRQRLDPAGLKDLTFKGSIR